ncbi:MAG: LPS assembly lipoprotein LptE [Endomicrobium sp.]|jgi:hypothetical protein|nr:LPS assembly lipoprotein LptE [Endomicrobium sp.]
MKKFFSLLVVFTTVALTSCTSPYEPAVQILPEYIKEVYVRPFINNTNQFGLEAKFTNAVVDEILSDGRLSLVNTEEESDGILAVTIKKYILKPLIYDINGVAEQYKLWIIVSVSFIDKDNNVTLWTEPNMEGIQIYRDITRTQSNPDMGDGISEEEAREMVWEKLSRNIVKRTIKGFGSVTSISEKKVPV